MKIAIVDDLKLDAEQLSHLILSYMKEHRIPAAAPEIFPNGETFLASFTVGSFDIVFLDIYMDGLSGMETAKKSARWMLPAGSFLSLLRRILRWTVTM